MGDQEVEEEDEELVVEQERETVCDHSSWQRHWDRVFLCVFFSQELCDSYLDVSRCLFSA